MREAKMTSAQPQARKRIPIPVRVGGNTIPEELRALPQWVARGREPGDKVPVDPRTGRNASITDPSTWGTYEEATAAVQKHRLQGVGFVFTGNDPYVGIDLDKCRDPQTGKVEEWAQEIVQGLNSFTELSPSGTGLHIIVKGAWAPGANRKGHVEVYSQDRYFTVTGNVVDLRRTIAERTPELEKLRLKHFGPTVKVRQKIPLPSVTSITAGMTDDAIIEKALTSANNEKFVALWAGVWQGLFPSHSEADLALANMLALHAGNDRERVDHLFRLSGLYRPKWDEKRGVQTYGETVLDKATAPKPTAVTVGHAFDAAVFSFDQLNAMDLPEQGFMLEPWLLESSLNLISAEAGTGKTFFAMEVAAACVDGRTAMKGRWESPKRFNVLILDGEMLPSELRKRARLLDLSGRCKLISKALFEKANPQRSLNLADKVIRDWLLNYVQEHRISLVVVDNIYSLFTGLDSNSDKEWQPMNEWLLKLKAVGVAVLIIHHTNKKGDQLGTSSRVFNLDTHLRLKKVNLKTGNAAFVIDVQKSRHQIQGVGDNTYELIDGNWQVTGASASDERTDHVQRDIAQRLLDGQAQKQVAEELDFTPSYVSQIKQQLVRDGLLVEDKKTKPTSYTLTDSGEEWMHRDDE